MADGVSKAESGAEKSAVRENRNNALKVALSVLIFFLSVSAVPIYNKKVFTGLTTGNGIRPFPYPMFTAFFQLGVVSITLGIVNTCRHFLCCGPFRSESWIGGPFFMYKLRHAAPVGIIFGLKYGITNWGLQLVPTGTHLLLQSTDLVWTLIFARICNDERLGFLDGIAAALSCVGAFLVGLNASQTLDCSLFALAVNLLTPIALALTVTQLRAGTKVLFDPKNKIGGAMTPIEFTAMKLSLSSIIAFVLACLLENGSGVIGKLPWWSAVGSYSAEGWMLMLVGTSFVLLFQVNITWLAGLTSATTVAMVGEVKVVPQWLTNAALNLTFRPTTLVLSGDLFCLVGSLVFAFAKARNLHTGARIPPSPGDPVLAREFSSEHARPLLSGATDESSNA